MVAWSKLLPTILEGSCHEVGHTWCESCWECGLEIFISCMRYSIKLYSPLYFVAGLVTRRNLEYFTGKMLQEIAQSCLFLSTNGALLVASFCLFRKLFGRFYMLSCGFLPGLTSSFGGIILERKSRRGLLALYMLNVAMETVYNILRSRGYIPEIRYGEVGLFMLATSTIMYLHRKQELPDGLIKKVVRLLLDDKAPDGVGVPTSVEPRKTWLYHSSKVFAAGYCLKMLPSLVMSLRKVFSKPKYILYAMFNRSNAEFGAFLGSLILLFRVFEYVTYKIRRKKDEWNSFIAGGIAGLSMLFQRSSTLSLYVLSKVGEVLYAKGAQKGYLPWYKHGDIIIYTLSTAVMFHTAILEPHSLNPTYWNFLQNLTNQRFKQMNRKRLDAFGLQSSSSCPDFDPFPLQKMED
eukprot:Seg1433.3 transcript_id=Seg1433.3/GoldUCD/mRNA.D3Y31 product="Transmembrane protein 135" protein_id=Seg1433.3/GoldUCD/D3Y31